jgi:hypothetical protein
MAYFFGGKQLEPGKPFSAGGTTFPGNYLDLSTPEEKKALGITEQKDAEPIRIAGEGPSSPTEETSPTNTANTTSFPETDIDDSTKQFLDSLGQNFFDQYLKPQYAGDKFKVQEGRLNYNKPETQKGGVIRYARPDKIAPLPTAFLPTTGGTPTIPTTGGTPTTPTTGGTPTTPTTGGTPTTPTLAPPPGTSPSITYPSTPDFKVEPPSSGGDDGGGNDGGEKKPPLTEPPGKEPEETFKVPAPTPTSTPTSTSTSTSTSTPRKLPELTNVQRYYKAAEGKHLYTTEPEKELLSDYVKDSDDANFNLFKDSNLVEGAADIYRLYLPGANREDHLYTTSQEERDAAIAGGYQYEGITGEAFTTERENTQAVQRFISQQGKHFYTADQEEIPRLAGLGYRPEGVAFYAPTKKSLLSTAYGNSPEIFGAVDYEAASKAGNTDDEIKAYIEANTFKLGEDMGAKFNLQTRNYNYVAPAPAPAAAKNPLSAQYGNSPDIFGQIDYDENIKLGYSDSEIENYIKANKVALGPEIAQKYQLPTQAYNYTPPTVTSPNQSGKIMSSSDEFPNKAPRPPMSTEYGNDPTIFGTKDYEDAVSKNYTDDEIKQWLQKENLPLGDDIAAKFRLAGQLYSLYK